MRPRFDEGGWAGMEQGVGNATVVVAAVAALAESAIPSPNGVCSAEAPKMWAWAASGGWPVPCAWARARDSATECSCSHSSVSPSSSAACTRTRFFPDEGATRPDPGGAAATATEEEAAAGRGVDAALLG